MRQHVNPLSSFFQLPLDLPSPDCLFANSELPIHLDIGSARGRFLLSMASLHPDWNYLGVEIRRSLVVAAEQEREDLGQENLKFLFCNVNVSLVDWLSNLPSNSLKIVSIQFPDPWFKRRHQKRRVLQLPLLHALANKLNPRTRLFLQSDINTVIKSMTSLVEFSGCFERCIDVQSPWLVENPFSIATERESYVLQKGLPVYRALYIRNTQPIPDLSQLESAYLAIKG